MCLRKCVCSVCASFRSIDSNFIVCARVIVLAIICFKYFSMKDARLWCRRCFVSLYASVCLFACLPVCVWVEGFFGSKNFSINDVLCARARAPTQKRFSIVHKTENESLRTAEINIFSLNFNRFFLAIHPFHFSSMAFIWNNSLSLSEIYGFGWIEHFSHIVQRKQLCVSVCARACVYLSELKWKKNLRRTRNLGWCVWHACTWWCWWCWCWMWPSLTFYAFKCMFIHIVLLTFHTTRVHTFDTTHTHI